MSDILFVPDPHDNPDYSTIRFKWLGKLTLDLRPDFVICAGDWADMPSLCSYDRGKRSFEGRRYKQDVDHVNKSLDVHSTTLKARKKKLPKRYILKGNHEHRIDRAIEDDPATLEGIISCEDLQFRENGWEVIDYNHTTPGILTIDGVSFAHYFTSGIMGRPIGGIHPAYQILQKQYMSGVQGHTHTADYCIRTRADGQYVMGLVAGIYTDEYIKYAGEANNLWWRGVVMLRNVKKGAFFPEFIGINKIKQEYSK